MTNLIETMRTAEVAEQQTALAAYREILARSDKPRKTDEVDLREAMRILSKAGSDLAHDSGVLRKAQGLQATIDAAETPEAREAADKNAAAIRAFDAETRQIGERRRLARMNLLRSCMNSNAVTRAADQARMALDDLRQRNPELFGIDVPEPEPAPPINYVGPARQV